MVSFCVILGSKANAWANSVKMAHLKERSKISNSLTGSDLGTSLWCLLLSFYKRGVLFYCIKNKKYTKYLNTLSFNNSLIFKLKLTGIDAMNLSVLSCSSRRILLMLLCFRHSETVLFEVDGPSSSRLLEPAPPGTCLCKTPSPRSPCNATRRRTANRNPRIVCLWLSCSKPRVFRCTLTRKVKPEATWASLRWIPCTSKYLYGSIAWDEASQHFSDRWSMLFLRNTLLKKNNGYWLDDLVRFMKTSLRIKVRQ